MIIEDQKIFIHGYEHRVVFDRDIEPGEYAGVLLDDHGYVTAAVCFKAEFRGAPASEALLVWENKSLVTMESKKGPDQKLASYVKTDGANFPDNLQLYFGQLVRGDIMYQERKLR